MEDLLVDPVLLGGGPGGELLGLEPQRDLVVGRLHGVGAVADVAAHLERTQLDRGTRLKGRLEKLLLEICHQ